MKKLLTAMLLATVWAMMVMVGGVSSTEAAQQTDVTNLSVKLVNGLSAAEQAAVIARNGGTEKKSIPALRLHVVAVPNQSLPLILQDYQNDPQVESVEVIRSRKAEGLSNDQHIGVQWALPKIDWELVYGMITPRYTAKIALLDTGIDAAHPDLKANVIAGTSILDGTKGLTDPSGHGTQMAGIVAAVTNNRTGVAGVAFRGVKLMPVTVLGADNLGQDSDIIAGIIWAVDNGANVILMGFSNPDYSQHLQDAIDYAWDKGAVLVAATGNNSSTTPTYPAGHRGVIGVSATDPYDRLAYFSNYGLDVFIAAPGTDIYTTNLNNTYTYFTGTSPSAAIVAGVAAFMKATDNNLTNGIIADRLADSADKTVPGSDLADVAKCGNGRVNMANALKDKTTDAVELPGVGGTGGGPVDPYEAAAISTGTATTATGSGTALSINKPTVAVGDLMILEFAEYGEGVNPPSTPSGWTALSGTSTSCGSGGGFPRCAAAFYRVVTSAGESGQAVTSTLGANSTSWTATIVPFSGVDTATPFDVTPGSWTIETSPGASFNPAVTAVSTTTANAMVVFLVQGLNATAAARTYSGEAVISPSLTETVDYPGATSSNISVVVASGIKAAAGSTGTGNLTASVNQDRLYGMLVALRAAGASTKLYMQNVASSVTTTNQGTWSAPSAGSAATLVMSKTKSGSIASNGVSENTNGTYDVMVLKLVSEPIAAQTISAGTTLNWVIGTGESFGLANDFYKTHAYVVSNDGTAVRGTLLANNVDTGEWATTATGDGPAAAKILSSVTAQDNDRIVIEIGYRSTSNTTTTYTGTLWYGGTGSDLTVGGNETTDTGWFEFIPGIMFKQDQTITYSALGDKTFGDGDFAVSASASSGLSVSFTSQTTGVCTATGTNGTTIHIVSAGTCTIRASQAGDSTYNAAPDVDQSFTVNKAAASAAVSNTPQNYTGSAQAATVTCSGGGAASNISTGGAANQTDAGTYAVTADCAASTNYNAGTSVAAGNFVINKITAVAAVSNTPQNYTGSTQAATVTCTGGGASSNISTGGAANQTDAGTYAVTADCAASTNYNSVTTVAAGNFVINKIVASASITNSPVTFNGSTQTAPVACLGGGAATLASGGSGINVGSYPATVNCAASTNYNATAGLSAGNFVINKATPVITWANPADITYGTALSATQLNASANTAGAFTYNPAAGAILAAGSRSLYTLFIPTDTVNYTNANKTVTINVTGAASYTITSQSGLNGTVTPLGIASVSSGDSSPVYSITAASGYKIMDVQLDGKSVGAISSHQFNNVTANHKISATFVPASKATNPVTTSVSGGSGGVLSHTGTINVLQGSYLNITFYPDAGYYVSNTAFDTMTNVTCTNDALGYLKSCRISNVTAPHSLDVTFSLIP